MEDVFASSFIHHALEHNILYNLQLGFGDCILNETPFNEFLSDVF